MVDCVLSRVLDAFEIPTMEETLPRAFLDEHGLVWPRQYGIAVRDVADACERAEALGVDPMVRGRLRAPAWHERGRRVEAELDVALGCVGDAQIEFLGPGRGTDFYVEALRGKDATLHHVGTYQHGIDRIDASLRAAGHAQAVRGGVCLRPLVCFDFRYYDTRDALGIYVEILDFSLLGALEVPLEGLVRAYGRVARRLRSR